MLCLEDIESSYVVNIGCNIDQAIEMFTAAALRSIVKGTQASQELSVQKFYLRELQLTLWKLWLTSIISGVGSYFL